MYEITKEKVEIEGKEYIAYGITNGEISIDDITIDLDAMNEFINTCNKYQLDSTHLHDIVMDFIG